MEDEASQLEKGIQITNISKILKKRFGIRELDDIVLYPGMQRFWDVFEVVSLLGQGAFSVVLEVQNKATQEISALKVRTSSLTITQLISQENDKLYATLRTELEVLEKLRHPNIIRFKKVSRKIGNDKLTFSCINHHRWYSWKWRKSMVGRWVSI